MLYSELTCADLEALGTESLYELTVGAPALLAPRRVRDVVVCHIRRPIDETVAMHLRTQEDTQSA